jgi:deoxyribose-phosphate aldolase
VHNDVDSITRATHLKGKVVKIILEMDLLSPAEVKQLCQICADCGVDYVKTSTGYHGNGATVEMIKTLKQLMPKTKIKASGGIRSKEQAEQLILAGASRIGTSAGIQIIGKNKA